MKASAHPLISSIQSSFGRFRQVGVAACAVALLLATGTLALAQSSAKIHSHKKTQPHQGTQVNVVTPTEYGETFIGEGEATHLGKFVSHGVNKYLGFGADGLFHGTGTQTDVAANGDTTLATFDWVLDVSVPMEDWVVYSAWKIVGGTGQFKNAKGKGTSILRISADGSAVNIWEGVITFKVKDVDDSADDDDDDDVQLDDRGRNLN